jgi:hypothetical protein
MDKTDVMKTALESEYINFDTIFSFKGDRRQLDEIEELSKKWGCIKSLLVRQAIAQFLFRIKDSGKS